jgi:hydrogenase-4 membrane subunit HyfE
MGKILHTIISLLLTYLVIFLSYEEFTLPSNLRTIPAEAVAFVLVLSLLYMITTPYSLFNKSFYKSWK